MPFASQRCDVDNGGLTSAIAQAVGRAAISSEFDDPSATPHHKSAPQQLVAQGYPQRRLSNRGHPMQARLASGHLPTGALALARSLSTRLFKSRLLLRISRKHRIVEERRALVEHSLSLLTRVPHIRSAALLRTYGMCGRDCRACQLSAVRCQAVRPHPLIGHNHSKFLAWGTLFEDVLEGSLTHDLLHRRPSGSKGQAVA